MDGTGSSPAPAPPRPVAGSAGAGVVLGVGLVVGIDMALFHQLLGWHHLYDRASSQDGLLSDGVLHAAELVALVLGGLWLAVLLRRGTLRGVAAGAGLLVGAGGFQLFDGLVHHKLLRLHQVRYGVDLWPYDLAWNLSGVVLLLAGLVLLRRARLAA